MTEQGSVQQMPLMSADDMNTMIVHMNSYSALLSKANLIFNNLLIEDAQNKQALNNMYLNAMHQWLNEFDMLKLSLEALNSKESRH